MRTRHPRPAPVPRSAFAGFRFPPDVIVLPVRWYLRFRLSSHDVEELLAERGIQVDQVTVPTGRLGWDRPIHRPVQPSSATTGAVCSNATGSTACSTNTTDKLHE
jgi:hypothetical protein